MSTHRHFDKICCVIVAFTLILTVFFMNAEKLGVKKASAVMGYEQKLFDTSEIHTIDIVMDDWDEFTANCKSEEYYACSVVIDNEAYKNIAIRGKGNTSLSQVTNDRYSYKIEFDHYDSTNTYYGLDKLCLNNIIQDNTYMKDYLTYRMMNEVGVASPLCSYAYITVNGEDWGLYLAVEGVEESFLQRNYGKNYGELYKPDSSSMGGGRGNGEKFDMDEFSADSEQENTDDTSNGIGESEALPQLPNNLINENTDSGNPTRDENMQGKQPPNGNRSEMPGNMQGEKMTPPDGFEFSQNSKDNMPDKNDNDISNGNDDVKLKYIDDDTESYSNIFDNAKTDISKTDKKRLIKALKKLSDGEDLENTVDVERVIRYFTVHNFVLNFDSYTGSMIHNYYLYENNGQMQMIPWDYNLAFGGFQSMGDATTLVNYPIDSPVYGDDLEDRPMIAWILQSEEYTELYHQYFTEFITKYFDSGYFSEMIDNMREMISPYVEKDPTKFCTYEEFETGIKTLKEFCLLRAESIRGQLNGTIGSTSDTQQSDTFVNAESIQIDDMGSMGNTVKGNKEIKNSQNSKTNDNTDELFGLPNTENENTDSDNSVNTPNGFAESENSDNSIPQISDGNMPGGDLTQFSDKNQKQNDTEKNSLQKQSGTSSSTLIKLSLSLVILVLGIIFALNYKRRG